MSRKMPSTGTKLDQNPSSKEWASIRAKFSQLYHVENKSLKEVRGRLEDENGFVASENAFKRRIASWGLQRSFNKVITKALRQHICQNPDVLCDTCSKLFSKQPKGQAKYQRYCSLLRRRRNTQLSYTMVLSDPNEEALRAGHYFWLHHAGARFLHTEGPDLYNSTLVNELTDIAIYLSLPNNQDRAGPKIENFHRLLREHVADWPVGVFVAAIWLAIDFRFQPFDVIRNGFFHDISTIIMADNGVDPHLRRIFLNIESLDALVSVSHGMISIRIQTLLNNFGGYVGQILGLIVDSILDLLYCQQPSEALQWATLVTQSPLTDHLDFFQKRNATALLARCLFEAGDYAEAVHVGRSVLSDCQVFVDMSHHSSAYTYINTCNVLARSYEALDIAETVVLWRTYAFNTSLTVFGEESSNTVYHRELLTKASARYEQYQRPLRALPNSVNTLIGIS